MSLDSDTVVGLQAKWFPESLDDGRIAQIQGSIDTARANYQNLRTYIVAIPQNLTKGTVGKGGKPRKGGVERWDELKAKVATTHPDLTLIRWDEHALLEQLSAPGNQELKALWFEGELIQDQIQVAWQKVKTRLGSRYLPDLHAVGKVNAVLDRDLWTDDWLDSAVATIGQATRSLQVAAAKLTDFAIVTEDRREAESNAKIEAAKQEIEQLIGHAKFLKQLVESGPRLDVPAFPTTYALDVLSEYLERFKKTAFHQADLGEEALKTVRAVQEDLEKADVAFRESAHLRLIAGPAGCGKTHAAAQAVDRLVVARSPAVLLMAREWSPLQGAAGLLSEMLDVPGWSLAQILDALEALAVLSQISASRSSPSRAFSRALIIIDGLEESSDWQRWTSVIHDLQVEVARRQRLHVVAIARPETFQALKIERDVSTLRLRDDGGTSLPDLLQVYCKHYQVDIQAVPWLGWALRSPLEVRLLAEEFAGSKVTADAGATANLLTLFQRKLERLEKEARDRAGRDCWSESVFLVYAILEGLSDLAVVTNQRMVPDGPLIKRLSQEDPEFTAGRVRKTLRLLVEYGLVDTWTPPTRELRPNPPRFGLATRHLADFVIAQQCFKRVRAALPQARSIRYPDVLVERQAAAVLFAAQLAEDGRFVVDIQWDSPPYDLQLLHLEALAFVPMQIAASRKDEIRALLKSGTAVNRDTIARLVVPVARIPGHPLGPTLLDGALRELPLVERDPIWSVPDDLDGEGAWKGNYNDILDHLQLDASVDEWNGRPLLAAWTCSSVVEARRRRVRENLAVWGSQRLDQMVLLLEHMVGVDDPQVVDDIVVAAFGAVLGADFADPAALRLAHLVDRLFYAEDAPAWTPSVIVRVAARGIIERAAMMFPGEVDRPLERCRPPYPPRGPQWPPIDLAEAREDSALGGHLVAMDLSWYVADGCFGKFSALSTGEGSHGEEEVDFALQAAIAEGHLRAPSKLVQAVMERRKEKQQTEIMSEERVVKLIAQLRGHRKELRPDDDVDKLSDTDLLRWASQELACELEARDESAKPKHSDEFSALLAYAAHLAGVADISPKSVRNGMIAHLVRSWGWSEERFSHRCFDDPISTVDHAIVKRHGLAHGSHGARSSVCTFREKYVWAAVERIAGELADRLPVWSKEDNQWIRLGKLDDLGNGVPDPLPTSLQRNAPPPSLKDIWEPHGILPDLFTEESDPAQRAERWLTEAQLPDPLLLVRGEIEGWSDATVLSLQHYRRGHQACVDQLIQVRAFGVRPEDVQLLKRDMPFLSQRFTEAGAWVEEGGYMSAAVACWAPWLTWRALKPEYTSFDERGELRRVCLASMVGTFHAHFDGEWPNETTVWIPAPTLGRALGVVAMRGNRYMRSYIDRAGICVAVERDLPSESFSFDHHYLAMGLTALVQAMKADGRIPMWSVRVYREATPALFMRGDEFDVRKGLKHRSRDVEWIVVGYPDGHEVICVLDVHEPWSTERASKRTKVDKAI